MRARPRSCSGLLSNQLDAAALGNMAQAFKRVGSIAALDQTEKVALREFLSRESCV